MPYLRRQLGLHEAMGTTSMTTTRRHLGTGLLALAGLLAAAGLPAKAAPPAMISAAVPARSEFRKGRRDEVTKAYPPA